MISRKYRVFLAKSLFMSQKEAVQEAQNDKSDLLLYSNGSKLEPGDAGAAVVWKWMMGLPKPSWGKIKRYLMQNCGASQKL